MLFAILLMYWTNPVQAQYYYNDIIGNRQENSEYTRFVASNAHKTSLQSFESDDLPSKGFFGEKVFNKDFSESTMTTRSNVTGESKVLADYDQGRIISSVTTTLSSSDTTRFTYDLLGKLIQIRNVSIGNGDSSRFTEVRTISYDSTGKPLKMSRVTNGVAQPDIDFVKDKDGNIIEEHATDGQFEKYFYYYDDQNRLTDVVHFNKRVHKLLPDYMFSYQDGTNLPGQMISVESSGANYLIWKYAYTDSGLPEIQKCYSKEKKLLGTIQYEYH